MKMSKKQLSKIIEAGIFSSDKPLSIEAISRLFPKEERLPKGELRKVMDELTKAYANRGVNLVEVASGYRFEINKDIIDCLKVTEEEKPARFTKAFLETLALIAYRQPITRGEIEDIRGVAVNTNVIKTLSELEWIREVGHKDVPGKPALLATSKKFLDFFGLKSLEELPPLTELQDLNADSLTDEQREILEQNELPLESGPSELALEDESSETVDESIPTEDAMAADELVDTQSASTDDKTDEILDAEEAALEVEEALDTDDIETNEVSLEDVEKALESDEDTTEEATDEKSQSFSEVIMTCPNPLDSSSEEDENQQS